MFHRGRANDLMKALGYRVSPLEVEAALAEHPSVAEVACAEVKVRDDVSVIAAFVVAHAGRATDAADIERFAAERLAAYKRPRCIVFVEALPRTANGKIMRRRCAFPMDFPQANAVASAPRRWLFRPLLCTRHRFEC